MKETVVKIVRILNSQRALVEAEDGEVVNAELKYLHPKLIVKAEPVAMSLVSPSRSDGCYCVALEREDKTSIVCLGDFVQSLTTTGEVSILQVQSIDNNRKTITGR